ncbi:MAG: TrkA family potassium uptake protein [Bacteroidales bacterium]|nr:TrkA family potassium uptake protein [Bacteroidales bacterium]
MKYIVIGLGNFGYVLADELAALGHEVIGVDIKEARADLIKDQIATSFVLDATDEQSLSVLPLHAVDAVIVTIGENFGASIRVVALLKKEKVKCIYARAIDEVHKSILEAFEIDKILTPEEDAALNLVHSWGFGIEVDSFQITREHQVFKYQVPERLVGYFVQELNLEKEFNLRVLGLKRAIREKNRLGLDITTYYLIEDITKDEKIMKGDELICFGKSVDFQNFWKVL